MKKLLALLMAMVLVFSLAACGGNAEPTDAPTDEPSASESASETAAPSESAAPSENGTEASGETESNSNGAPVAVPQNQADAVKFYNDALAKVSSQSASVKRQIEKAKVLTFDLDSFGPVSQTFAEGSGPVQAKLAALNAGDVASYTSKDNGNSFTMEFKLKNTSGDMNSKHGKGGYMYFLTIDEVAGVVKEIGDMLSGGNLTIEVYKNKSTFELQNGVLSVTVAKDTGKITGATLSFKEVIVGKCKAPLGGGGKFAIDATANITGGGTVTFKVA